MRPAMRLLAAGALLALAGGCTPGATHRAAPTAPQPSTATTVPATQPQASAGRLGAAGCHPPSPATPWLQSGQQAGIEVHGTARGAELWALPFAPVPLPVGKQVKIVWRMTGSGPLRITATRGDGICAWSGPRARETSGWLPADSAMGG